MNPIGKPVTATVYLANSRANFLQGDVDMSAQRSRMRSAITGYPNPLTDVLIKNMAEARKFTATNTINLRGSGIIVDENA